MTAQEQQIAAQIDHFLLGASQPGQGRGCPASQPSEHLPSVSRLLHDRLSHVDPEEWPLDRLYDYLKTLFEPSTPPRPTTQDTLAVAPSTPTSNRDSQLAQAEAAQSPRTARAQACLPMLTRIDGWTHLKNIHKLLGDPESPMFPFHADYFAQLVLFTPGFNNQLVAILPELNHARDKRHLASAVRAAYTNLAPQIARLDSDDQALALALVHAAVSLPAAPQSAEVMDANARFASQFGRTYRGNAPSRFLAYVTQVDLGISALGQKQVGPYYRGTPIVQSSGTGKTRMVLECRHQTPLLYVCVRPRSAIGNAKAGYPFPDQGVLKFFEEAQKSHPSLCDLQVACFLGAWFSELSKCLRVLSSNQQKNDHLLALNSLDQRYGENHQRDELFQSVTELASLKLKQATGSKRILDDYDAIFDAHIRSPLLDLNEQLRCISDHLAMANKLTASSRRPPVIVAFDECVELNVAGVDGTNNPLNSLRRAWNYISKLRSSHQTLTFWLVLMSTSSSAADFVRHFDANMSFRDINSAPLPTFVGIGFDALLAEQPTLTCASEAAALQHITFYGRPLWSSLAADCLWDVAMLKLTGDEDFMTGNDAHCFSVMASRLALSLVPTHPPRSPLFRRQKLFMDRTVDRHMRIVKHVTDEGAMYVESPSEPVLAIAASLFMLPLRRDEKPFRFAKTSRQKASNTYGDVLESFRQRCLLEPDVTIFEGSHGELASRIALMIARDAAKQKLLDDLEDRCVEERMDPPTTSDYAHILLQPVALEDMLAGLADLDEESLAELRGRIQDVYDAGLRTDRSALQPETAAACQTPPAWINFTHFDVLPEEVEEVTPEYLWYCWKRGVALQMSHRQPGIDGIIPVFMGDLNKPFVADNSTVSASGDCDVRANDAEMFAARCMTYVAWKAKNREQPHGTERDPAKAAKLAGPVITRASFAPPHEEPLTKRALLSVLLDLGTTVGFSEPTRGFRPRLMPIAGQECPRLCIRGASDKHAYPCLDVFAVRDIFGDILFSTSTPASFDHLNTMPSPLWNEQVQPNLHSVSPAKASGSRQGPQQTGMDLD